MEPRTPGSGPDLLRAQFKAMASSCEALIDSPDNDVETRFLSLRCPASLAVQDGHPARSPVVYDGPSGADDAFERGLKIIQDGGLDIQLDDWLNIES